MKRGTKPRPAPERFWEKVQKTDTCWIWTAYRDPGGYGKFNLGGKHGPIVLAHVWAWEQEHGPVPDGLELDHVCRNRACVRPDPRHLEPVTHHVNILRGESGAYNGRKTHCLRGHSLADAYLNGTSRHCRECFRTPEAREAQRIRDHARRKRDKET